MKKLLAVSVLLTSSLVVARPKPVDPAPGEPKLTVTEEPAKPSKLSLLAKAAAQGTATAVFAKLAVDRLSAYGTNKHWSKQQLTQDFLVKKKEEVLLDTAGTCGFAYLTYVLGKATLKTLKELCS